LRATGRGYAACTVESQGRGGGSSPDQQFSVVRWRRRWSLTHRVCRHSRDSSCREGAGPAGPVRWPTSAREVPDGRVTGRGRPADLAADGGVCGAPRILGGRRCTPGSGPTHRIAGDGADLLAAAAAESRTSSRATEFRGRHGRTAPDHLGCGGRKARITRPSPSPTCPRPDSPRRAPPRGGRRAGSNPRPRGPTSSASGCERAGQVRFTSKPAHRGRDRRRWLLWTCPGPGASRQPVADQVGRTQHAHTPETPAGPPGHTHGNVVDELVP